MIPGGNGVPIIGRPTQIVLREQRIIRPAAIDVLAGGLDTDDCEMHVRVIDPANGIA